MRVHEILSEAMEETSRGPVLVNPGRTDLRAFLARFPTLRGLISGSDLFLWDAHAATHGDLDRELGVAYDDDAIDLFVIADGFDPAELPPGWARAVERNPILGDGFRFAGYGGGTHGPLFDRGTAAAIRHRAFGRLLPQPA
jgi:hypothetical protein